MFVYYVPASRWPIAVLRYFSPVLTLTVIRICGRSSVSVELFCHVRKAFTIVGNADGRGAGQEAERTAEQTHAQANLLLGSMCTLFLSLSVCFPPVASSLTLVSALPAAYFASRRIPACHPSSHADFDHFGHATSFTSYHRLLPNNAGLFLDKIIVMLQYC